MSKYSIKEVETLSGIKAHTLRIWEQRYDIIQPERTPTNIRYYSDEQLKKILNISLLNTVGYKISKIALMSNKEINTHIKDIKSTNSDTELYINRLIETMVSFDKEAMLQILNNYTNYGNLETFFIDIVFPFLNRVGILWASSDINPAQEHFSSQIIKRFLIKKIEQIPENTSDKGLYVLLLPEGEYHELSLLFTEYILNTNGKKTLYLGPSVPYKNLNSLVQTHKVEAVICVMIIQKTPTEMQHLVQEYKKIAQHTKVYFCGSIFNTQKISKQIKVLKEFSTLKNI